jgi:hypothetical protein
MISIDPLSRAAWQTVALWTEDARCHVTGVLARSSSADIVARTSRHRE